MFSALFSSVLEIPVIPDLDDFQEEDLANKIAAPPRLVCDLLERELFIQYISIYIKLSPFNILYIKLIFSVQVNRVATYKELDNDFQKHLYLLTLV